MKAETKVQNEIWKPIDFTNGKYSVSNKGRVKNNGFYANIGNGLKRWVKPRIKRLGKHNQGYFSVSLHRSKTYLVHRLVAGEFLDNPQKLEFVNHIDGNKTNNNVDNLEWCTRQENETHAFKVGLKNSTGSNNTMSKLTEEDVKQIKYKERNKSLKSLSEKYDVHRMTISRIQRNLTWKHV